MKAPEPPHLRKADQGSTKRCGTCKMFDHGKCWGYANYRVDENETCDSYSPDAKLTNEDRREIAKHLWAQHRKRLEEA